MDILPKNILSITTEEPNDSITKMVGDLEIPYKIIGNAKSVRKIFDAVKEGYLAAKEI
ncbi:MAG: hypothetical protein J7J77_00345 [Candidatus Cloacimonetes bacterium]|nr:hypothetical protein [Candidatus Cloacimonadota bacterium]